jgi:hypothetical protein
MAVPTNYVFTSGSCAKSAIYQLICDQLTAAGWTDIASLASADFKVFKSAGNTGDKNLLLNIRDTSAAATNSIVTTDFCVMSYRLQDTYVPGATGVAGVFGRPTLAWSNLYIAPVGAIGTTLGKDTVVNYKIYADASKLILEIEYPNPSGLGPMILYIGEPDSLFVSDSASRGVLVATSAQNPAGAALLSICNTSDTVASVTGPYNLNLSALLPAGDPNAANKFSVSSIYYGSAAEGFRGKLDGIKCAFYSGTNLSTGDTITIGTEVYYVVITMVQVSSAFPSRALLIRTA